MPVAPPLQYWRMEILSPPPQELAQEQMDYYSDKNNKLLDNIQDPPDIDHLETLNYCLTKWAAQDFSPPQIGPPESICQLNCQTDW